VEITRPFEFGTHLPKIEPSNSAISNVVADSEKFPILLICRIDEMIDSRARERVPYLINACGAAPVIMAYYTKM
jgi:hypothetical protein